MRQGEICIKLPDEIWKTNNEPLVYTIAPGLCNKEVGMISLARKVLSLSDMRKSIHRRNLLLDGLAVANIADTVVNNWPAVVVRYLDTTKTLKWVHFSIPSESLSVLGASLGPHDYPVFEEFLSGIQRECDD